MGITGHLPFACVIDNHLVFPPDECRVQAKQERLLLFSCRRFLIRINTSLSLSASLGKSGGWIFSLQQDKTLQSALER